MPRPNLHAITIVGNFFLNIFISLGVKLKSSAIFLIYCLTNIVYKLIIKIQMLFFSNFRFTCMCRRE